MYCEWHSAHWDADSVPRTSCGYRENLCLALRFQQCFHCQLSTLTQCLSSLSKINQPISSPSYCSANCWFKCQTTLMWCRFGAQAIIHVCVWASTLFLYPLLRPWVSESISLKTVADESRTAHIWICIVQMLSETHCNLPALYSIKSVEWRLFFHWFYALLITLLSLATALKVVISTLVKLEILL